MKRLKFRQRLLCAGVLIGAAVASAGRGQSTQPAGVAAPIGPARPPAFVIGVWQQPPANFTAWKARGVNTLVCQPSGQPQTTAQWSASAEVAGLFYIRQPDATKTLAADSGAHLLAWMHADEPDAASTPPAVLAAAYAAMKAAAPTRPVLMNLSGGYVLGIPGQGNLTQASYVPYLAAADWISGDIYPVTGWGLGIPIGDVGQLAARLMTWAPGKPLFAVVECSNQGLPWVPNDRSPTPAEVRCEVFDAIIHGAKSIVYFPQSHPAGGGAFAFDGTAPEVATEITWINAALSAQPFWKWVSQTVALPAPFEARQWTSGGDAWAIGLNLSAAAASLPNVTAGGVSIPLDPYGVGLWHNGAFVGTLGSGPGH